MTSDKDKIFIDHLEKLSLSGVEVYGRLSIFWLTDNVGSSITRIAEYLKDGNYEHVKANAGIIGAQLLKFMEEIDVLNRDKRTTDINYIDGALELGAAVRDESRKNGWIAKFDEPYMSSGENTAPIIAKYLAKLLDVDDINLIRAYDVRVVLQLSSEVLWKYAPPYTMRAGNDMFETSILIGMTERFRHDDANISLSALRREAEIYVRDHLKIEPHNTDEAFEIVKGDLYDSYHKREATIDRVLN